MNSIRTSLFAVFLAFAMIMHETNAERTWMEVGPKIGDNCVMRIFNGFTNQTRASILYPSHPEPYMYIRPRDFQTCDCADSFCGVSTYTRRCHFRHNGNGDDMQGFLPRCCVNEDHINPLRKGMNQVKKDGSEKIPDIFATNIQVTPGDGKRDEYILIIQNPKKDNNGLIFELDSRIEVSPAEYGYCARWGYAHTTGDEYDADDTEEEWWGQSNYKFRISECIPSDKESTATYPDCCKDGIEPDYTSQPLWKVLFDGKPNFDVA